ncbi:hypothetical protein SH528x_002674 [Novipirellula sp. SH528]|uniref:hypothetical protein n=1 Tax=Novipirellula sp. SH528 TaxID=3454466 RepID=UPI003F9ECD88
MRRLCLGTCMLALALTNVGCRQTTGPTAGGPLTPVGPMAPVGLTPAPVGGMGASAFSPTGAATRVPPPPNNSFQNPGGGPASFVPYGQANAAPFRSGNELQPFDSFSSNQQQSYGPRPLASAAGGGNSYGNQAIGSGVATTGWTETNAQVSTVSGTFDNPNQNPNQNYGNPANGYEPANSVPRVRFNGMQVNDLTGAPPTPYNVTPSAPYAAPMQASTMSRGYYPPSFDNNNAVNLAPQRAPAEYRSNPQYNPQPTTNSQWGPAADASAALQPLSTAPPNSRADLPLGAAPIGNERSLAPGLQPAPQPNNTNAADTTVNAFELGNSQLVEHQPRSSMAPAFQGAQRFTTPLPGTTQIGESVPQTADNNNSLRWGRPRTAF